VKLCGVSLDCGSSAPPSDPVECKDNMKHLETLKGCISQGMPPLHCSEAMKSLTACYEKISGGNL
jgi:hypothetical protein